MNINNAEKFQVCRAIGWEDFEGATNIGKSDIQYLIYLFMAEIENYSRKQRNHKYLSVFSKNKTIPNKDSIMWIRSYSSVQIQKQSI